MKTKLNGIEKLRKAVDKDLKESSLHDYESKYQWILERADHYAEVFNATRDEIIEKWEEDRSYWYMNYYQDSNQPLLSGESIKVFATTDEALDSFEDKGFRCPKCAGESKDPYECSEESCDWKSYGLFGTMGKGVHVAVKEKLMVTEIFKPIAWEGGE